MWLDWLKRSIAGRPAEPRTIGFVCVCRDDASLFANAQSGSIVRIENRGPPWIVVNHELATAVITSWPVRIWRASVIEAASEADQVSVGGAPKRSAGYTRAISVEIGEEVPPGELFGPNGAAIAFRRFWTPSWPPARQGYVGDTTRRRDFAQSLAPYSTLNVVRPVFRIIYIMENIC